MDAPDESGAAEAALVTRAVRGEEAAIRHLVSLLTPAVQIVVNRYAGGWRMRTGISSSTAARDELYQEVMLELFAKDRLALRRFDPERGRLLPYVKRIAAHVCLAFIKRQRPQSEEWKDDIPDPTTSPETLTIHRHLVEQLYDRFVATLDPLDLRIFMMLFVEEKSYAEVEAHTGINSRALHTRKYRLRHHAIETLRELERDEVGMKR